MPPQFFVFDVESVGLHGEGFSVGYVVVEPDGREVESGIYRTRPQFALGRAEGHKWVQSNVVPALDAPIAARFWDGMGSASPEAVRECFWTRWMGWRANGAILAADCPWPVEARFLIACVEDDPISREREGPYPLIDIASVRLAAGLDPLGTADRLPHELPQHNPLADARQSARLLIEALRATTGISV